VKKNLGSPDEVRITISNLARKEKASGIATENRCGDRIRMAEIKLGNCLSEEPI